MNACLERTPISRGSEQYHAALDGLRGISVAAVVAYHLGFPWARGGFLGVDVFFVLSGYLITWLLLEEVRATGKVDLRAFWLRRARRLLPSLLGALTLLALWAALAAPASEVVRLRQHGLATLVYAQNWLLIHEGESYFDMFRSPSPLRHTWSLAVEGQFYLVWPLVVLAATRRRETCLRTLLIVGVLAVAASAFCLALLYEASDLSRAYYSTEGRIHVILCGALLALGAVRWKSVVARLAQAGTVAAALCVTALIFVADTNPLLYRGGLLLFAICVSLVVASTVREAGNSRMARFLNLGPLRWLGLVSYEVYLYHWPVIVILNRDVVGRSGLSLQLLQCVSTLVLSWLSYSILAQPFRTGALRRRVTGRSIGAALTGVAALLVVTTVGGGEGSGSCNQPRGGCRREANGNDEGRGCGNR